MTVMTVLTFDFALRYSCFILPRTELRLFIIRQLPPLTLVDR